MTFKVHFHEFFPWCSGQFSTIWVIRINHKSTKMKQFYLGGLITLLVACQEQALPLETENELLPMRVEASIAQDAKSARTAISGENLISFSENDCIGLFVPWENTARKWTYIGSVWSSESSVYWKDKENEYAFYAYYPCGSEVAASKDAVPLPNLSSQTGTLDGLAAYDFLVASVTTKYSNTNNGTLSFTGSNAFQHVLGRISFTINNSVMDSEAQLVSIQLSSVNLHTKSVYNLLERTMSPAGGSTNDISSAIVPERTAEILVNPVTNATVTISLVYRINSEDVTVSSVIENLSIEAGKKHTMQLKVQQGQLKLESMTIESWEEGTVLPEVTL